MSVAVLGWQCEATMRTVAELTRNVKGLRVISGGERPVSKVRVDSRRIEPNDLFVAVPGLVRDGMEFARDALARGASGVVGPVGGSAPPEGAWIVAEDPRLAAALLSSRAWGNPSEKLDVIGITGTNGKTTTCHFVRSIWEAAGRSTALFGTLGARLPRGSLPQARTTPEAPDLHEMLARAVDQGASMAVMEVSSHSLDLKRVDGISFAAAAFLNLTPEHLDWHRTIEAYAASKRRLFAELLAKGAAPSGPRTVLNAEDPWAGEFRRVVKGAVLFALEGTEADVTARGLEHVSGGSRFTLETKEGSVPVALRIPGAHNVQNALAASSLAHVFGIPLWVIAEGLAAAESPAGRFERVHAGSFDAYVDYAHTEDGLSRALRLARELARGRVILVLGCGGDRDASKRPVMGRIAAELADVAVFTSDNPRSEDPRAILEMMLAGVNEGQGRVNVIVDREEALSWAVEQARGGDVLLAAGKGHETYQSVAGVDHPFHEREILRNLARRKDGVAS